MSDNTNISQEIELYELREKDDYLLSITSVRPSQDAYLATDKLFKVKYIRVSSTARDVS